MTELNSIEAAPELGSTGALTIRGIDLKPVKSSLMSHVGYYPAEQRLIVRFVKSGRAYEYLNLPLSEFTSMMGAESVGKYFQANIAKNKAYPFTLLGEQESLPIKA